MSNISPLQFLAASYNTADIMKEISEFMESNHNTVTYGRYTCSMVRDTLTIRGGDSNNLSESVREMLMYAIASGAVFNSIYESEELIPFLVNYRNYYSYIGKYMDNNSYSENSDPYGNLTDSQKETVKRSSLNTDKAREKFLLLVSSFLNKPVTISDFSDSSKIPIVKADFTKVGVGLATSKRRNVLKAFSSLYSEIIDNTENEYTKTKLINLTPFYDNIYSYLKERNVVYENLYDDLKYISLTLLLKTMPSKLSLDERALWVTDCCLKTERLMSTFFDVITEHDLNSLLGKITIFDDDTLHDISKVLIGVLAKREAARTGVLRADSSLPLFVKLVLKVREKNEDTRFHFYEYVDCILIYLSIYGTSKNRVAVYPATFEVIIRGSVYVLDMSDVVSKLMSESDSNEVRIAARSLATRTYLLRKTNNIQTTFFKNFSHLTPYLSFDFCNYIDDDFLTNKERGELYTLRRYIAFSRKVTNSNSSKGRM